jgi:hypothetical protein
MPDRQLKEPVFVLRELVGDVADGEDMCDGGCDQVACLWDAGRGPPLPWQQFVDPRGGMFGDPGRHIAQPGLRSTLFILAVTTKVYIAPAGCPPRSEPANSHDFLPRAIAWSFCPCLARS